jgi:hypothetical protein
VIVAFRGVKDLCVCTFLSISCEFLQSSRLAQIILESLDLVEFSFYFLHGLLHESRDLGDVRHKFDTLCDALHFLELVHGVEFGSRLCLKIHCTICKFTHLFNDLGHLFLKAVINLIYVFFEGFNLLVCLLNSQAIE